jgi:hypothetical protein
MFSADIPSCTTMPDFPEHPSPGNWRPIIRGTDSDSSSDSSSSENVSRKGAKFLLVCVVHFPVVETDNPVRPFRLNARGDFENPSLKSMADIFIGCMIAHGCDPGNAKNLAYSSLLGVVDVLPLMGPHDWHSKKADYIAPNDYDTAMSQMAEASSEMLEALPSIFPNFHGYFLFGEAYDFFQKYMGKSKHPVLNTEEVVHPTSIACKWWDTDHQLVAVHQACHAMSAATGLDFHHSNIKNFDDVMPVSAAMKRKSEERLDAAIRRREDEEERLDAAIRRVEEEEERLLDAAIRRREDKEERLDAAIHRVEEEEERLLDAAIRRREDKEERLDAAIRIVEEEEERLLDAAVRSFEEEMNREMKEAVAAAAAAAAAQWKEMKEAAAAAVVATAAKRKEIKEAVIVAMAAGVSGESGGGGGKEGVS